MSHPINIEAAKEINFEYPKNSSFKWQHTIVGGYTSATYKMIINEGEGQISVDGVKSGSDIITYSITKTQMSSLTPGNHPYKTRVVESDEINPVYVFGTIKII